MPGTYRCIESGTGSFILSKGQHHATTQYIELVESNNCFYGEKRFCKCGFSFITLRSNFLDLLTSENENVLIFAADNWKTISRCTTVVMADFIFFHRNRRRLYSQGTDSRSTFASLFSNPVGLFSQEGFLYNPRQRLETVRGLSRQETRTSSDYRRDTKHRSSGHGKMASKTVKNRYISFITANNANFVIIFCEFEFSRDCTSPWRLPFCHLQIPRDNFVGKLSWPWSQLSSLLLHLAQFEITHMLPCSCSRTANRSL